MKPFRIPLCLLTCLVVLLLSACDDGDQPETSGLPPDSTVLDSTLDSTPQVERSADWLEIEEVIKETIIRLRYGDKSGLYENEFGYLREDETFDQYLKHGEIEWANADSLERVEIEDIQMFGRDSASIEVVFHIMHSDGKVHQAPQRLVAYYFEGRWIKPYMSSIKRQKDYEELIRQADEDAEDSW